jgi:hypothetical protein
MAATRAKNAERSIFMAPSDLRQRTGIIFQPTGYFSPRRQADITSRPILHGFGQEINVRARRLLGIALRALRLAKARTQVRVS